MHLSWAEGTWAGSTAPAVWSWGLGSCSDCMWPLGIYRPFPRDPASLFSILFLCSLHEDRGALQTGIHFLGASAEQSKDLSWQEVGVNGQVWRADYHCQQSGRPERHRLTVHTYVSSAHKWVRDHALILSVTRAGGGDVSLNCFSQMWYRPDLLSWQNGLRQEGPQFKAILNYIARPVSKVTHTQTIE